MSPSHTGGQNLGTEPEKLSPASGFLNENQTMAKEYRVIGPYAEGGKFRLVVFMPERRSLWCHSREEAEALRAQIARTIADQATRTVGDVLAEYLAHLRRSGLKDASIACIENRLTRFLPQDASLSALTSDVAATLYSDETQRVTKFGRTVAACTHRMLLRQTKAFFRWVIDERRYLSQNPFEKVKPIGRVNTGKAQLTIDEARTLNAWLLQRAESGDEGATAVLVQLVLGLRSSEVLGRRVRDLDDGGRALCIPGGKTKNARRSLSIESEPLRALLQRQTVGKRPEDLLFGSGKLLTNDYLWDRLQRYCVLAGVPKVCPHSLRGLHSTIAMERGATSGVVAAALGHGSFAVTARHYVHPDTLANAKARKVSAALASPTAATSPARIDLTGLSAALSALSPDELAAVLRSVGKPL
ncbi:MAG: tyrosine-type recombinase/integrase [Myxococcales bacterium]|nr:tyrosine-type recombinase/integrase [Myxococcales bacterium]